MRTRSTSTGGTHTITSNTAAGIATGKGESYVGASIEAVEWLAELPPVAARLKFHAAEDFFAPQPLRQARDAQALSAAVCARIGFGDQVALDDNGDPCDGEMLHLVRDTPYGCVLRSRFLLGKACANAHDELPDDIGFNLMRHCYNEFSYLAQFLPSLYYAENGANRRRCSGNASAGTC